MRQDLLFPHEDYVSMTMEFRCNLRCVHCMIEGTMDRLQPETDGRFRELLAYNAKHRRWKGLILTGSEITLRRDLPDLAREARAAGFAHIRIQSHGMALEKQSFCDTLVAAGIDEYFISVAGSDAMRHDAITTVEGSFAKTLAGLENLDRMADVKLITNTVVTKLSYEDLSEVVDALSHLERLVQMEFWVYWPMRESDDKDLVVPFSAIGPHLSAAIDKARRLGRKVEVKNFPECLLGSNGKALVNTQPQLYVDEAFWSEFARNGFHQCVYREACASTECLGLNTAYIDRYGYEADLLRPLLSEDAVTSG